MNLLALISLLLSLSAAPVEKTATGAAACTYETGAGRETTDNQRIATEFGAIPNDLLDDTDAINRAIAAMPHGGVLLFPAGEYRISSLTLPGGLIFRGEGPNQISRQTAGIRKGTVLIAAPGMAGTAILIPSSEKTGGLEELSLYLDAAAETGTLLSVSGSVKLKNVEVAGMLRSQATGIHFRNAGSCELDNVSAGFRLRFGMVLDNGRSLRVTGGKLSGWDIALLINSQEKRKEYLSFEQTGFHRPFDADAEVIAAPAEQALTGMGNQPAHFLKLIDIRQGQHILFQQCHFSGEEPDEEQRPELPPGIITNAIVVKEPVRDVAFRQCSWENVYLSDLSKRVEAAPGPAGSH